MVQGAPQTAGRFDAEVRMHKAPPLKVSTKAFYETDPARGEAGIRTCSVGAGSRR